MTPQNDTLKSVVFFMKQIILCRLLAYNQSSFTLWKNPKVKLMIQKEIQNVLHNKYTNDYEKKLKMLEALYLAEQHLKKHLLTDTEIVFRNHSEACGKCYNDGEKISLQINYVFYNEMEEIENTILHEIAHALVGNDFGHNSVWQEKAKELGVTFTINYRK
jgi:hypothetical protein